MNNYFPACLIQLYAKDVEDIYLTCNPTITFFKKCYRKYDYFYKDHFLLEDIMIKWDDTYIFKIPKDIHYIGPLYVKITIPYFQVLRDCINNDFTSQNVDVIWTNLMQLKIFKSIQLLIDDNIIEKLDYDTYIIYINYLIDKFTRDKFYKMIKLSYDINNNITFYLPIIHMFTLEPSFYLPIKILNRSNIKIKFIINKIDNMIANNINKPLIFTNNVQPIINISYDYIIMNDDTYNHMYKNNTNYILYKCLYSYQSYIINKKEHTAHINLYNRTIDLFLIQSNIQSNIQYDIQSNIANCDIQSNIGNCDIQNNIANCDIWYFEYINNNMKYKTYKQIDEDIAYKSHRYKLLSYHNILFKYDIYYMMYLDEKYLQHIKEDLNNINMIFSEKLTILTLYFTKIHFNINKLIYDDEIQNISIKLNGINLIQKLPASYYNNVIPYLHGYKLPDNYYMYSFSYNSLIEQANGMLNLKFINDLQIYSEQNIMNKYINIKICTYEYRILEIQNNTGCLR